MNGKYWAYVSQWADRGAPPGLALYEADASTGKLSFCRQLNKEISFGCSFVDEKKNILYICNETERIRGTAYDTGRIYGYQICPEDGSLTELFHKDTYCPNPCFIGMDPNGEYMIVAHQNAATAIAKMKLDVDGKYIPELTFREAPIELFAVNEDGVLGELLDVKKHEIDPNSIPYGSFPHCAVFSPSGNLIAVCDKGDGCVYIYTIDRENKKLKLLSRTRVDVPGATPRYCVFHPEKPYFVVNNEKYRQGHLSVASFEYSEEGQARFVGAENVLANPVAKAERNQFEQQGLCISSDGRHIYSCIKGVNAICTILLNDADGSLSIEQYTPIDGVWPRGMAMMPGGKYLVTTCLISGEVASYAVAEDGRLSLAYQAEKSPGSTYVSFCAKN